MIWVSNANNYMESWILLCEFVVYLWHTMVAVANQPLSCRPLVCQDELIIKYDFQTFFSLGTSLPGLGIGGGGIYRSAVDVVASCRRILGGDGGGGSRSTIEWARSSRLECDQEAVSVTWYDSIRRFMKIIIIFKMLFMVFIDIFRPAVFSVLLTNV